MFWTCPRRQPSVCYHLSQNSKVSSFVFQIKSQSLRFCLFGQKMFLAPTCMHGGPIVIKVCGRCGPLWYGTLLAHNRVALGCRQETGQHFWTVLEARNPSTSKREVLPCAGNRKTTKIDSNHAVKRKSWNLFTPCTCDSKPSFFRFRVLQWTWQNQSGELHSNRPGWDAAQGAGGKCIALEYGWFLHGVEKCLARRWKMERGHKRQRSVVQSGNRKQKTLML